MAVLWPQVADYLVSILPTLWPAPFRVFDGVPLTGDSPADYISVGHVTDDTAGSWDQAAGEDGTFVHEIGSVRSQLVVQTGDDDRMDIVRTRAAGYVATLDAHIRAHQTLGGLLSANATVLLGADVQGAKSDGTAFALVITLTYTSIAW